MAAVRALQRRVARLEQARRPLPSKIVLLFGAFDTWVENHVVPDIRRGLLCERDMADIIAALRGWENNGDYS